jgi:chain length determinant protein tyrosine kinase EpsG
MNAFAHDSTADPAGTQIGDILQRAKGLSVEQVNMALSYQREHGVRFGEAVVAMGLARGEDVVWALSQQFHYPYLPEGERRLHPDLVLANQPFVEEVEAFRDLRSQLVMGVLGDASQRCALAITSSDLGDGKTFAAANLAIAFAQLPGRTLLIDANLRQPRLHQIFGVKPTPGLSGVLAGRHEEQAISPIKQMPNLYLMPAGAIAPNPAELLQQATLGFLLREMLTKFDHVLVDTPAHAVGSDARVIGMHCGAALIVGRKHASRMPRMQALVTMLNKSKVKLAGVLVNEF